MPHIEEIRLGDPWLKDFVELLWRLYRDDPCWTPPLKTDLLGNRLLGMVDSCEGNTPITDMPR
ncbi:MAG: hypothetical protein J7L19_04505 [Dehalococcoidia bacterium]|nr:hypothetical protein [Dehalococcoidia bacterium]